MQMILKSFYLLMGLLLTIPSMSQSKYAGTFEHKESGLKVSITSKSDNYEVQMLHQGTLYMGTAVDFLGFISGTYGYNGQQVEFSFSRILGQYFLSSDGTDIPMTKVSEAAQKLSGSAVAATTQATTTPTNALEKQWWQRLAGKRLLYLYTGNGFSEKWHYDLCSNGTYAYADDASYTSGGNFSAITANNATGTWKVVNKNNAVFLLLSSKQNGNREFRIGTRQASNEVGLNDKRYFITTNERCR